MLEKTGPSSLPLWLNWRKSCTCMPGEACPGCEGKKKKNRSLWFLVGPGSWALLLWSKYMGGYGGGRETRREKERKGRVEGGRGRGQEGKRNRMVYVLWREVHLKKWKQWGQSQGGWLACHPGPWCHMSLSCYQGPCLGPRLCCSHSLCWYLWLLLIMKVRRRGLHRVGSIPFLTTTLGSIGPTPHGPLELTLLVGVRVS